MARFKSVDFRVLDFRFASDAGMILIHSLVYRVRVKIFWASDRGNQSYTYFKDLNLLYISKSICHLALVFVITWMSFVINRSMEI